MQLILASLLSVAAIFFTVPQPEWTSYVSAEGKFTVLLPDQPQSNSIIVETERGKLLTHIVSAGDKDLNQYMVSWTDYKSDIEFKGTEKTFDRMRDALIEAKNGKLLHESLIFLEGRPGRACEFIDSDGRTVNVRFFFIGNRSYQLQAESRKDGNLPDAERFMKSFRFSL